MIYYIQNSFIGLAILLVIYSNLRKQMGKFQFSQKIFISVLAANALLLFLEFLLNVTSGINTFPTRIGLRIIVLLFYILSPIPEALWILYVNSITQKDNYPSKKFITAVSIPVLVNTILSFLSLSKGYTFYINPETNTYSRGNYYIIVSLICYSYVLFYVILVWKRKKLLLRHEYFFFFISALPPIIAGIIQSIFYGVSIVWLSLSISMLIIYLNLQSVQIYTDHLTGLANRRKFDNQLTTLLKDNKPGHLGGIMIDLDDFKQINDNYGHDLGDKVLEALGELFRRIIPKNALVARIGGDEFVVLIETDTRVYIEYITLKIQEAIKLLNDKHIYPKPIQLSMGYDLIDLSENSNMHPSEFLKLIDAKMYTEKNKKKSNK